MEAGDDMGRHLLHDAYLIIILIYKNDLFHYTLNLMLRMSPSWTT